MVVPVKTPPPQILVFGNPFYEPDAVCLKILPGLRKQFPKTEFIEVDAVEEFHEHGPDLVILDAVKGIEQVNLLDDSVEFEAPKRTTMHDFDLAHALALLKKLKKIRSAQIIGVPLGYGEKKALEEVARILSGWKKGKIGPGEREENLWHVTPDDRVIGPIRRAGAHARKLLHRAGVVLVFNLAGDIFLTKRSRQKSIFPGCIDAACSFHVTYGETYGLAARRELAEETGLTGDPVFLGTVVIDEDPDHLVAGVFSFVTDAPIRLDFAEAEKGRFYPWAEANTLLKKETSTHWLRAAMGLYAEKRFSEK